MTLEEIKNNNNLKLQELIEANLNSNMTSIVGEISKLEEEIREVKKELNSSQSPNGQLINAYRVSNLGSEIGNLKNSSFYQAHIEEYTKKISEINIRTIINRYLNKVQLSSSDIKIIIEYFNAQDIKSRFSKEEIKNDIELRESVSVFDFDSFSNEELEIMREISQKGLEISNKKI